MEDNDKTASMDLAFPAESPVIELPADDLERRAKLERKLEEYRQRLVDYTALLAPRMAYWVPEMTHPALESLRYRIFILERLLRDGRLETWAVCNEMIAICKTNGKPMIDGDLFDKACGVIDDYAKTGGMNLGGGTGLK